ncbi:hypothetical protein Pmani_007005 [Petrolisthes manimaculis]|uniref:Integrase p58-like C-terminal domain-containing protein n=1 Tax=Petrolisthes manimaculis TaxID=1843537 RepID=A0AAE1QBD9_9EUCA|nr:hypothetical protein Pmani_007005 [Petrolisthes manimaculis]
MVACRRTDGKTTWGRVAHRHFQLCEASGDNVWFYTPRRNKGRSPKLQSPWEGPYTVLDRLLDVTYQIRGGRKSRPRLVHVNHLWQYHGPGQYSWDGSEESCSPTDEDVEKDIGVEVQEDGDGLPSEEVDQQEDGIGLPRKGVDQQEDQDLQGTDCVKEQGECQERQTRRPNKFDLYSSGDVIHRRYV